MNNLGSHKVTGVRQAIEAVGASLMFIPPYSPDLNPIEMAFAKLKALLRAKKLRTLEGLWNASGNLVDCFTPGSVPTSSDTPDISSHPENALETNDKVSRPAESHRQALAEPGVRLSPHPAPIVQPYPCSSRRCANNVGCRRAMRASCCCVRRRWRRRDLNF